MTTRDALRRRAIAHTLFAPTTLARAVARIGFVQADPIRAPAPAQDLVLRHRVRDYVVGDLDRRYAQLAIDEDYLYAYGFATRALTGALHPRPRRALGAMDAMEKRVLAVVRELGRVHPRDVAERLGNARVENAWGGQSRATTHALDALHHRGALRVAKRERGVRVYELAPTRTRAAEPSVRLTTLVLAIANVLSPIRERTLRANAARFRHLGDVRNAIEALVERESLVRDTLDGESYVSLTTHAPPPPHVVRFLAPFDPLVWDRTRTEHLFGVTYRFEAYTPAHQRVRGYYALPILFRDVIVGFASFSAGALHVAFEGRRPRETIFARELEKEIVRIRTFAKLVETPVTNSG